MNIIQKAKILLEGAEFTTSWVNGPLYRAYVAYTPGMGIVCSEVVFEEAENNTSLVLEQKAMDMVDNMILDKSVDPSVMRLVDILKELTVDFDNDHETLDDFIYDVGFHPWRIEIPSI